MIRSKTLTYMETSLAPLLIKYSGVGVILSRVVTVTVTVLSIFMCSTYLQTILSGQRARENFYTITVYNFVSD